MRLFAVPHRLAPVLAALFVTVSTVTEAADYLADEARLWRPHPIHFPVAPDQRHQLASEQSAADRTTPVRATLAPVEITPNKNAIFWLDELNVVRISADNPGTGKQLRFGRVITNTGTGTASEVRAIVEEPGIPVREDVYYLAQPPGGGSVWYVTAKAPVRIRIEHVDDPLGHTAWESLRRTVMDWIAHGRGDIALLPFPGATEMRARLHTERDFAAIISATWPDDSRLAESARAWRTASALQQMIVFRPLLSEYFRIEYPDEHLADLGAREQIDASRSYRRLDAADRTWQLTLTGPGVLRVDVRALLDDERLIQPVGPLTVTIETQGRTLGRSAIQPYIIKTTVGNPNEVFPLRVPVTATSGEGIGPRQRLTIATLPGSHVYTLRVNGGPALVRVTYGQRRPLARESLRSRADAGDFINRARRTLKTASSSDSSQGVQLVSALIDDLIGPTEPAPQLARNLPPVLAVLVDLMCARARIATGAATASEALDRLIQGSIDALADAPDHIGWYLRVEIASLLSEQGRYDQQRAVLGAAATSPPTALLAALASALPPPDSNETARSRRVGMFDLAWRAAPADAEIRRRYRTVWREDSAWQRLTPTVRRKRRLQRDASIWLKRDDEALGKPNVWGLLPFDQDIRVLAPTAPSDANRPALMRLAVSTPANQPGPVTVTIDGKTFSAIALRSIERWQLAVAPGRHKVRVQAPAGSEIYCSLPTTDGDRYVGAARIQRAWPLTINSEPVRFDLPSPHVQGPLRVRLRALLTPGASHRSTVQMVTEMGPSRVIEVQWGDVDANARVVDGTAALSAAASFVVTPPIGARRVWFESTSDLPIIASVAVRRPLDVPFTVSPQRPEKTGGDGLPQEQIAALSEGLSDARPDPETLTRRAHLLLDLGFPGLARRDAARVLRPSATHEQRPFDRRTVRELLNRLDTVHSPAHLPATSPAGRAEQPVPVFPAALALPGRPSQVLVEAARLARSDDPEAALQLLSQSPGNIDPRARYAHARITATGDQPGSALLAASRAMVKLHEDTRTWQVAHDACAIVGRLLELGHKHPGLASFAYGVSKELGGVGTLPIARRVLNMASPLSGWDPIHSSNQSGGFQNVMVEPDPDELEPRAAINNALIAPPWRDQGPSHILRPGKSAQLTVNLLQPTSLRADIWCRRLLLARPGDSPDCRVTVRVDGQTIPNGYNGQVYDAQPVPLAQVLPFITPVLSNGTHHIHVELASTSRLHRAAVRFSGDRPVAGSSTAVKSKHGTIYPIPFRKKETVFQAMPTPAQNIVVLVNGPTTLRVNSRTDSTSPASALNITVQNQAGTGFKRALPLSRKNAPNAALRWGIQQFRHLTDSATVFIPIPDDGPHTVTLAPDVSVAYVRMAMRVDQAGKKPQTPSYWKPEIRPEDELIRWPGAANEIVELKGGYWDRPGDRGTFSVEAAVRRNLMEDEDTIPLQTRLDVTLNWRKQIVDDLVWLHMGVLGRRHFDGRSVFGARARVQTALLPLGLRTYATAQLFTQVVDANPEDNNGAQLEWRVTGRVDIERPVRLTPDLQLLPELSVRTSDLSLNFDQVPVPGPEIDTDVYSLYTFFHRHTVIPRVALRWRPFQDQIGSWSVSAVPNADLVSLDRVHTTLSWTSLVHLAHHHFAVARVSYRPSYRFYDEDRFDAYTRHDFSARLEASLWTGRTGRLLLRARAATYLSRLYGRRHTFSIGLTYDLTGGRGLRDMFSFEEDFDPYAEGRLFTYDEPR